jgi:hypothetical protein
LKICENTTIVGVEVALVSWLQCSFLFSILQCSQSGDHPEVDLAEFGDFYRIFKYIYIYPFSPKNH